MARGFREFPKRYLVWAVKGCSRAQGKILSHFSEPKTARFSRHSKALKEEAPASKLVAKCERRLIANQSTQREKKSTNTHSSALMLWILPKGLGWWLVESPAGLSGFLFRVYREQSWIEKIFEGKLLNLKFVGALIMFMVREFCK